MDITFVGPVPPLTGGISHHSSRLVEALRAQGDNVRVLSWKSQYPKLLYRSAQVDTDQRPFPGTEFDLKWWSVPSWWKARRIASRSDLVVFPYVTPFLALPQRCIVGGSRKVVAIVHNAVPHERMPMQRPLARLVLRRADLLITHGQGTVEQLRELGIDREALVVSMPPTLDLLPVRQQPRPPLRLLFLGFVRPYKGVGVAIDAMRVLQQEKVAAQLTVAGEFWDPVDGYRQQVSDLGLQDRVELRTGYLTDVEVRDILATHHIVVAPYLDDTLSGIVPLAFAAGRPVVSTAVGGISEQVADGHNGILVKPGDPEALAAGIQVAAERLEELSAGAVESSSSWALVAAAVTSSFQLPPRAADEVTPRGFNAHRN